MPPTTGLFTIITKSYLPYARVLMASVRRHHPDFLRVVILVDRPDGFFDPAREDFTLILSQDLSLPQEKWFHFKYTTLELCTAVKPYVLEFLLRRFGLSRVVYLDADVKVYSPLAECMAQLDSHNVVLTPHLTSPLTDDRRPTELDILRTGVYNLGFIAIAASSETDRMLWWWQARLYDHCVVDLPRGLFVDQRWADFTPALFAGVSVIREPGYNVAYWNLPHREVRKTADGFSVNGKPLRFLHFSGFDPDDTGALSKHQDRYRLEDLGDARGLFEDYADELRRNGYAMCKQWPYAYGFFADGTPIADVGRPIHHESPGVMERVKDPFSSEGLAAFLKVWNAPLVGPSGIQSAVTKLAYRVYRAREDVQAAMPDLFGSGQQRFIRWMLFTGRRQYSLHESLLAPLWNAAAAADKHGSTEAHSDREGWPQTDLNESVQDASGGAPLTRLAMRIYSQRPDLQRFFPDPCGRDAMKFLLWLQSYGDYHYDLGDTYLRPLREEWDRSISSLKNPFRRMQYPLLLAAARAAVRVRRSARRLRPLVFSVNRAVSRWQSRGRPARGPHKALEEMGTAGAPVGVNLIGYMRGEMGVGTSARSALAAARAAGLAVRWKDIRPDGEYRNADMSAGPEDEDFPFNFNLLHVNADQTPIVVPQLPRRLVAGRYNIGYWAWELEEFPDRWLSSFDYLDEIWVPSTFCQDAIARKSPKPVIRIPHCVALDGTPSLGRADFGLPDDKFLFLSVYDALSGFHRKNPMAAVTAFIRAFGRNSDCVLVIKVNHADRRLTDLEQLRSACRDYPIVLIDRAFTRAEVLSLINACDCLISLHRSEGFGLTLAEAMLLGKPVLCTAYSGNMDFTKSEHTFLVQYEMRQVGPGSEPYDPDCYWAEPSIDHAVEQMRRVRGEAALRCAFARAGQDYVRSLLSPITVGEMMKRRLAYIGKTNSNRLLR
jgi:glycosyltransferase involved in cell wall biosynthesis